MVAQVSAAVPRPRLVDLSTGIVPVGWGPMSPPPVHHDASRPLPPDSRTILRSALARDLAAVAPDLGDDGLAAWYADALFATIGSGSPALEDLVRRGSARFYAAGRDLLGPHAVQFVHAATAGFAGHLIFPKRDADPFHAIACRLRALDPETYPTPPERLHNPVFNRLLWGTPDPMATAAHRPPDADLELARRLLRQCGLGGGLPVRFVEVGCWGTMVDALRRWLPDEPFSVCFLYSHLPEHIDGFLNHHRADLPESVLETVADTWEAFPKHRTRSTRLVDRAGRVVPVTAGTAVASPFLRAWSAAAMAGVVAAADAFVAAGHRVRRDGRVSSPADELQVLAAAIAEARTTGRFTGLLPRHTTTWPDGAAWRRSWPHGPIPPLG